MRSPFRRKAPPPPAVAFFPIDPQILKADLAKLRGRSQADPVLGPVLRVLVETRARILAGAEHPNNPNVVRSVYRAAGVTSAIQAIVAATRSGEARHQQTGFGEEEQ